MGNKKVYIPGFGNNKDVIYQNYLHQDAIVVQKNIKTISPEIVKTYLTKYGKEKARDMIKHHYPKTDDDTLQKLIDKIEQGKEEFKGFTRKIQTTVNLSIKEMLNILQDNTSIEIVAHSQGGLIAMLSIIQNPVLLKNIDNIELLAPVTSFTVGRNFHKTDEGYLHPKNIIVQSDYIKSLEQKDEVIIHFLEILKQQKYTGKLSILLGSDDPIIKKDSFDIEGLQKEYPFLHIEIKTGDHYLGFKK